jgi:hypothetical protein
MRNLLVAACCAALMGSISVASAETTGKTTQGSMKTHHPMGAYAKMKKKSTKKTTPDDTSKDSMSKGDASKDSMKKDSTSK